MQSHLVELRKQAEQAVDGMPDGDLKVKAFETILSHLLASKPHAAPAPKSELALRTKANTAEPAANSPSSLGARIQHLATEGFFASQRSIDDIRQELKKNGWHYPVTSISGPLQLLVQKRILRRENVLQEEGKKGWKYSNP
jgi:hypothetical protein